MTLKIIPNEDFDIIKKYLDNQEMILIPERVLATLPLKKQEEIKDYADGNNLEDLDEYNFGEEPDVTIDLVDSNHYFLCWLGDNEKEEK